MVASTSPGPTRRTSGRRVRHRHAEPGRGGSARGLDCRRRGNRRLDRSDRPRRCAPVRRRAAGREQRDRTAPMREPSRKTLRTLARLPPTPPTSRHHAWQAWTSCDGSPPVAGGTTTASTVLPIRRSATSPSAIAPITLTIPSVTSAVVGVLCEATMAPSTTTDRIRVRDT